MNTTSSNGGSKADLAFGHSLVDIGVPVFHARLSSDGAPHRPGWEKIEASHEEVNGWRKGQALCAHTGVAFDVLDVDPRHGGWESYKSLKRALGRDPDFYAAVRTRSGGLHMYIPPLGLGTHHPASSRWPGVDLQGKGAMVFIPPTHRLDGDYVLRDEVLSDLPNAEPDSDLVKLLSVPADTDAGVGRQSTTELWKAVLSAPEGAQREALLRWVDELEKRYEREDAIAYMLAMRRSIPVYDKAHPWRERDLMGMLHDVGERIPDDRSGLLLDPEDDELPGPVRKRLAQMRVEHLARIELESWKDRGNVVDFSTTGLLLSADIALGVPPIKWAVENLATMGAQVTLPSSRKTGKTTFLLNLARSAGDGTPFLDRFDTCMDGNIGYINAEMLRADILGYVDRLGNGVWHDRVRMLHCRESGLRLNLMSDSVCEQLVSWCVAGEVEWLIADPWKNFLGWSNAGINDNDAVLALSDRFRQVGVAANLSLVIIPMHTTQTPQEEGSERGKGAGELEDGADWLWRYTRIGEMSEPRTLSAEGRGPGLSPMVITWDPETGLLSCDERVSKRDVIKDTGAQAAREALDLLLLDGLDRVMRRELVAALHGTKTVRDAQIRAAVNCGIISEEDEGEGRPTWYS